MSDIVANIIGPDGAIILVVVVVVLFFGGSKLPQFARGLGSATHEFKKGLEEGAKGEETENKKTEDKSDQ
jgi:sec-independent protein translocase protein TatA